MKYFKVTVPVGYEVYKLFKANSESEAQLIAFDDLESNFQSWDDYGGECLNMFRYVEITEISKEDFLQNIEY